MIRTELFNLDTWQVQPYSNVPIGKRVKRTVTDNSENVFYYKEPIQRYPWEFWTEIAASKIGQHLGFNVLDYNIGVLGDSCGCISKSMVDRDEELIHGQQLLTQINPSFDKKKGTAHSFQIIQELFVKNVKIKDIFDPVLKMLVYDAVIGNHDRHQQNWALIRKNEFEENWVFRFIGKVNRNWSEGSKKRFERIRFSPFFDNGNCLAYNITNGSLIKYIDDNERLLNYAFGPKAKSHIRWNTSSISHFELLKLVKHVYRRKIDRIVKGCLNNYDSNEIGSVIDKLDEQFDNQKFAANQLTVERKVVMKRLVALRIEKLKEL